MGAIRRFYKKNKKRFSKRSRSKYGSRRVKKRTNKRRKLKKTSYRKKNHRGGHGRGWGKYRAINPRLCQKTNDCPCPDTEGCPEDRKIETWLTQIRKDGDNDIFNELDTIFELNEQKKFKQSFPNRQQKTQVLIKQYPDEFKLKHWEENKYQDYIDLKNFLYNRENGEAITTPIINKVADAGAADDVDDDYFGDRNLEKGDSKVSTLAFSEGFGPDN